MASPAAAVTQDIEMKLEQPGVVAVGWEAVPTVPRPHTVNPPVTMTYKIFLI